MIICSTRIVNGGAALAIANTLLNPAIRLEALNAMGAEMRKGIVAAVSLTDHSLADLARLGHPYAKKHGSIQVSRLGHAGDLVHTISGAGDRRTGRMVRSVRATPAASVSGHYDVDFDFGVAPHAKFVLGGTKTMLPRDPAWWAVQQLPVRRAMMRAAVDVLGKKYRTKAAVRFTF